MLLKSYLILTLFFLITNLALSQDHDQKSTEELKTQKKVNLKQEYKITFGLSKSKEIITLPKRVDTENGQTLTEKKLHFKDPTRGLAMGYGISFFQGHLFSLTSSLNVGHYRNDLDHSMRSKHYRFNHTYFSFEQQIHLDFEKKDILYGPYLSGGYGVNLTKSSYRFYLEDNQENLHLKSKGLGSFARGGAGFRVLDKTKDLFSFIDFGYYFPNSTKQKTDITASSKSYQNLNNNFSSKTKLAGPTYQVMIGAGGQF